MIVTIMESGRPDPPSAPRNSFSRDLNNAEFLLSHLPNIFVKDLQKIPRDPNVETNQK